MKPLLVAWGLLMLVPGLLAGHVGAVHAQGDECPPEYLAAQVEDAITALQAVNVTQPDAVLDTFDRLRLQFAAVHSLCRGWSFSDVGPRVYDPMRFPQGFYRVTVTTEGYFILRGYIIQGKCADIEPTNSLVLLNVTRGEAANGAQALLPSGQCTIIWETSNVSEPYELSFEMIETP
jgi:hypothetical protein